MKINPANLSPTQWRAGVDATARSRGAHQNVEKLREISETSRLRSDDTRNDEGAHSVSSSKKNSLDKTEPTYTYEIVNSASHKNSFQYNIENDAVSSRTSTNGGPDAGFVGRINSRLNQFAINSYRSNQVLERRDEIISVVGINEIA